MEMPKCNMVTSYKDKDDKWQNVKIGSTFTKDGKFKFVITVFGKPIFGTFFEQKDFEKKEVDITPNLDDNDGIPF